MFFYRVFYIDHETGKRSAGMSLARFSSIDSAMDDAKFIYANDRILSIRITNGDVAGKFAMEADLDDDLEDDES